MRTSPRPPSLPSPTELGLPEKFTRFYDDQIVAIDKVVTASKRFVGLGLPTGAGKSLVGVASALLHPDVKRALYLTSTKGLQDQASGDFPDILDVRGQRNYPCTALQFNGALAAYRRGPKLPMCDEGPCHAGVTCLKAPDPVHPFQRPDCEYFARLHDARGADTGIVLTNYAMYFAQQSFAQGLGAFDLLILDEAHDTDKELEGFLTFEVSADDCRLVGMKYPKGQSLAGWVQWADKTYLFYNAKAKGQLPPKDAAGARERRQMKGLLARLKTLRAVDPLQWIMTEDGLTAKFAPLRIASYAESVLFRNIAHVVLMSATMTTKTLGDLGLSPADYTFWEAPSRFPVERRPVISIETTPSVRVDSRMDEDDKVFWLRRIDRIIEPRRRLGWKGIIHTVSYQRMRDVLARSEHRDIMLSHDTAGTREAIRRFKDANGPLLLVSPSLVTGYDFPGDDCRYQIIAKVPLPDMRDPIMKRRGEIDKEYSGYLAMQKLVQACGRSTRGPDDWSEVFIVDNHFSDWFMRRYTKHAPRWFRDAVDRVESFPEPLIVL